VINTFVTNIHISFAMACFFSFEPSTSTISLQKAMASTFGGIVTPVLTPEGLAKRQPQIYSTKLKFQNLPSISFRHSISFLVGLSTPGVGF
jgi:hypothetical protein